MNHGGYLPPDGIVRLDGCDYTLKFKRTLQSTKDDFPKHILAWLKEKAPDIERIDGDSGWLPKEEEDAGKEAKSPPTR